jgi:hypothetical protein
MNDVAGLIPFSRRSISALHPEKALEGAIGANNRLFYHKLLLDYH